MSLVVAHPTGIANLRALLKVAARLDVLDSFWTSLAFPPTLANSPVLPLRLRQQVGRRTFPEAAWSRTRVRPQREVVRLLGRAVGLTGLSGHERGWASVDQMYRHLDRSVARYLRRAPDRSIRAVYSYEDGALESFRTARSQGIASLYHLPIPHWRTTRRILAEEGELQPDWAPTMQGLQDSEEKLARKDEEIALADRIVVASTFTKKSLDGVLDDSSRVITLSYGSPPVRVKRPSSRAPNEPLRLIHVGHLTGRKGVAYLIAALRRLDAPWQLTLAGTLPSSIPESLAWLLQDPRSKWLGHVPNAAVLEHMSKSHVLVFPSLVEGFGMVIAEAMAAGLPVITTPNTAGPDVLREGREGYIVPIRDPDAIADRLARLYADEGLRQTMATAALTRAASAGWETYQKKIAVLLKEVLN
jgi:glycosyltransferase involved in cell wall biosynthesis